MAAVQLSTFLDQLTGRMAAGSLAALTDRQLVERALAGPDEAVFRVLVRRHGAMVYRVCRRVLRHHQDAEDAFQATFLVLARKLGSVHTRTSLASWLHGVARRVALQARDRAALRRRHEQQVVAPREVPPDDVAWGEVRAVLDDELVRLPEKWRQPLVLCYLEGRTQDEAAGLLGWGKTTLRNRLGEARAALARRLARRGVVGPAALPALLLSDCVAPAAPPGLLDSTARAAAHATAGRAAGGVVPPGVTTLVEGIMKPVLLTRLRVVTAGLLAVTALAAGAVLGQPVEATRAGRPLEPAAARPKEADPPAGAVLAGVSRVVRKEPAYTGRPRYGLLVLGQKAETRVWLVVDGDTLYVDRNGNGDLTEPGERVPGKRNSPDSIEFRAGPFTEADGKTQHTDLIVYQYFARQYGQLVNGVLVMGVLGTRGQGTSGEDGGAFADAAKDAPIIHVSGPLILRAHQAWVEDHGGKEKWRKEVSEQTGGLIDFRTETGGKDVPYGLKAGERVCELLVQVGTPGLGRGTFAALAAENGPPADFHPVVEVAAPGAADPTRQVKAEFALNGRGGTWFYGPVGLPGGASVRTPARLTLSFPAWREGKVTPAVVRWPMVGPATEGERTR
jgi:RNA polymerase sigma factor (sigma-70 family)